MEQDGPIPQSFLALDCGDSMTRALLIHREGGDYQLVGRSQAQTTVEPPWNDLMAGVRHAVNRLSQKTNWRLMDEQGRILSPQRSNGGVDAAVAVVSAGSALRILLVGTMEDMSLSSARRALSATHSSIVGTVSMDRGEGRIQNDDAEGQVRLVHDTEPDVIVIVGGVDGGPGRPVLQSVRAMALACAALPEHRRPTVLYAGNAELQSAVAGSLGDCADLRFVDNVLPRREAQSPGPLYAELERLHSAHQQGRLPGLLELASWCPVQVLLSARAFGHSIEYLAHKDDAHILGVDVGGSSVTVASVVDGQFELATRADLGPDRNAHRLLDLVSESSVLRWLPFEMSAADLRAMMLNRSLRGHTLPQTRQDLLLEHALAREVMRYAVQDVLPRWSNGSPSRDSELLPRFQLLVGGGGLLAHTPSYGLAALTLLDALQPAGMCGLSLDRMGLLAPLAGVAQANPLAAASVMKRDALLNLCTVVVPIGQADKGTAALDARIEYPDGRIRRVQLAYGSLEVAPIPKGQEVTMELRPTKHFDVGLGTKGQSGRTIVKGGAVGIIFDARGRPLSMVGSAAEQRERMQEWLTSVEP